MRTAEDSSGTVLHRLIQEQLRYGNLTDNRTLLAIQQQAMRGGNGSPRSSLESLTQEECQMVQHSTRQEPQGQEHQGDHAHSEHLLHRMHQLQLNGEELPTYEEAKAHSQFLAVQRNQQAGGTGYCVVAGTNQKAYPESLPSVAHVDYPPHSHHDEALKELKHGHVRSLSERLMQLSLERNGAKAQMTMSSSNSFPQLSKHNHKYPVLAGCQAPFQSTDPRGPPPDYPFRITPAAPMLSHSQQPGSFYNESVIPYIQCQQKLQENSYYSQPQTARATRHQASHSMQQNGLMSPNNTLGAEAVKAAEDNAQIMHVDHVALINRAQQMVEMLLKENENLRKELNGHTEKSAKIQKLEREIQRISEAYDNLMKASSKRETLEKAMRNKMEGEIRRLHDFNRDLREKLESAHKMLASRECEVSQIEQNTLSKLMNQNKDHLKEKEKLQRELCLFRNANEDQRRRTQALEQALNSTQTKVIKLEDELRKKRAYVEKVEKLQHALTQLQAACEKREQLELRLRNRLEQELKALRTQQRQATPQIPGASEYSAPALMELLREKEERILALEADMTKWEQKYLEESTMRQFAMDAAATAAAQRDTTIINHSPRHSPNSSFNGGSIDKNIYFENGDIMVANHRHQEMESRIKALHAQILEKDAIIKVLQQRSKRDQTKTEQPRLRPAKSVPSITVASSMNCNQVSQTGSLNQLTNERLNDNASRLTADALLNKEDLRVNQAAVSASLPPTSHAKHGSRDGSTQTDKVAENGHMDFPPQSNSRARQEATFFDTSELPNPKLHCAVKNLELSDTEMVEILI